MIDQHKSRYSICKYASNIEASKDTKQKLRSKGRTSNIVRVGDREWTKHPDRKSV